MWFNVSKALRLTEKFVENKVNSSLLRSLKNIFLRTNIFGSYALGSRINTCGSPCRVGIKAH
jgi:hypothetical protein